MWRRVEEIVTSWWRADQPPIEEFRESATRNGHTITFHAAHAAHAAHAWEA